MQSKEITCETLQLKESSCSTISFYDCLGRVLNFCLAITLLVVFSPLMILISLAILILDGRPILYRGKRLGKNGYVFTMYKFRTLVKGAENRIGGRLMMDNEGLITTLGHFLRAMKLDEAPQLFNILRGDMNFVGPRPVRPAMAETYRKKVPGYDRRFGIKPGLTGLAQLRGGYYCPPRIKTRYDVFYINKRNFLLDMKLFLLTGLRVIFSPRCLKRGYNANGRPVGGSHHTEEKYRHCKKTKSRKAT